MSAAGMIAEISRYIQIGHAGLHLSTYEENRWRQHLAILCERTGHRLLEWSTTNESILDDRRELSEAAVASLCEFLQDTVNRAHDELYLINDLSHYWHHPVVIRHLKDCLESFPSTRKTILSIGPLTGLPLELAKEFLEVKMPLPTFKELLEELDDILQDEQRQGFNNEQKSRIATAVLGLTLSEASRAFRSVTYQKRIFDEKMIAQLVHEKRHLLGGSKLLEFHDLQEGMEEVGGLENLKSWVQQRRLAFSADAREQGIDQPKGVLLVGVQGCGKSLSARVIAHELAFPLVRLDIGALLSSQRGSSEENLRDVLSLLDSMAPVVLWIEELDKAFAGFQSESSQDATMSRLVARFLTWLQEHTTAVFVVATANNVSQLPPELLRRGRFDELFFIDLPNYHERLDILRIHLQKRLIPLETVDVDSLSEITHN